MKRPVSGKILRHAEGMGVPSPETVRQRARELALIEGREHYTEIDWRRAHRELHGGNHDPDLFNLNGPDDEMAEIISERDMIAPTLGHHNARTTVDGSASIGEELVAEGLDEAEHDRMLKCRLEIDVPEEQET